MAKQVKEDKPVVTDSPSTKENLADLLKDSLNEKFKKSNGKVAYFLDGSEETPTDLTHWVSTGSTILDIAISNRKSGGLPFGRIVELMGMEASGKSLMSAHILAETQRLGGVGVYIDTENAMNEEFCRSIGVDVKKLVYSQLETVEDIFEAVETLITKIRESNKDRLVTIVIDSMAAASTAVEMEADYSKDGWATSKAIVLSKAMRKITQLIGRQNILLVITNQLRTKLGVTFGENTTTSGGFAVGFHSSVRLRLKNTGQIKGKIDGIEQVIGMEVEAQVKKNRCGPPLKKVKFKMYFDRGIDDMDSWMETMIERNIVTKSGMSYIYVNNKGEEIKFLQKNFPSLMTTLPELKVEIYDKICEALISSYRSDSMDSIEVTTDTEGDS